MISTILFAALQSHNSGTLLFSFTLSSIISCSFSITLSLSMLTNKLVPCSTVTGLSVLVLKVMQGIPKAVVYSGVIPEETTALGISCITLRTSKERPVTVEQGTNLLVSIDKDKVIEKLHEIIDDKVKLNNRVPELWDGNAAKRIVDIILKDF